MRKIGINTLNLPGLSTEDCVALMAQLGFSTTFTGVPTPERIATLLPLYEKHGIEWETMHAPFAHINDIWRDCEGGKQMYEELIAGVDCCAKVGVPNLVVHLSAGGTPPQITDIGRARFTSLVEYAGGKNVRIAFENQRKLANIAWAMETFWNVPQVGFCFDCGHEACFTPDREYMPLFGKRLCCLHLHDNDAVFGSDQHLLPFDGKVDFARVARQIRESDFDGSLMLEVTPRKSNLYDDLSPEEYLTRAAAAAKRLREMVENDAQG